MFYSDPKPLSVGEYHLHAPTGVFVETKATGISLTIWVIELTSRLFRLSADTPTSSLFYFIFFLLCRLAIFGGFTYLHGLGRQSASLKLGIRLPIVSSC